MGSVELGALAKRIMDRRKERIEHAGAAYFPNEARTKPSILVVDDDILIRESLKRILESAGYVVFAVAEGGELANHVVKYPFDLMILDIHLPWLNGVELCKILRDPTFRMHNVPLVFLSGDKDQETMKLAFSAGCDDYLLKPIDPEYLLSTVSTLIKISQVELQETH